MKRAGIVALLVAIAAVLSVVFWKSSRRSVGATLPPVARYDALPAQFQTALAQARVQAEHKPQDPQAIRALAQLYHANGVVAEAELCYQNLARMKGGLSPQDHYALADLALNQGDLERARRELEATVQSEPGYTPARNRLGEVLFKLGETDAAEKVYHDVLSSDAVQPQATLGLARIELQRGQEDAAIARLERLLQARPESASAANLLAQLLDRRGESDRALAMVQASRQRPEPVPVDPWLDSLMSACFDRQRLTLKFEEYLMAGQIEPAMPLLNRVEELDPGSWIPHLLRGWTQARAGRVADAVAEYETALRNGGDPEKVVPLLVQTHAAAKNLTEAARVAAEYTAKQPDSVPLLTAYSEIAMQQNDTKLARTLLTKLLQKEPYLYTPNLYLAKILWTTGERDEAVECLQRIVKVFPVDVASRGLLGQYFLEKSDPRSAIMPLEQALPHADVGSPAHNRIAAMLHSAYLLAGSAAAEKGDLTAAAEYFTKATQADGADVEAYAGLAGALVQLKQWERAAAALGQLNTLQPENPTVPLSLGDVLYQGGEHDKARAAWQRALQLTTAGDGELREVIQRRLTGPITAETFQ